MSVHYYRFTAICLRRSTHQRGSPLSVTFGSDVYMDGVDIDHQRFYEMLVERDELPKTGQVNPYAFSQAIASRRPATRP